MTDPSREDFERLRRHFDALVELPTEAQRAALAALSDPALRARLVRMLRADDAPLPLVGHVVQSLRDHVLAPLPERLGRYRVLGLLGRGGMGIVLDAQQDLPERRVALKMPSLTGPVPADAERALRQEVQAMAELLDPGIPQVFEVFDSELGLVIAMERVDGVDLTSALRERSEAAALSLLIETARVVAAAHARSIVHRDLKPANVLVTPAGQPKVLDFGIAALRDAPGPIGAGTPHFAAPEQLAGAAPSPAGDVFALGRIALDSGVFHDAAVIAVLTQACDADPSARPPHAGALEASLARCRDGGWVTALPWHRAVLHRARRVPVSTLAGAAGLLAAALLLILPGPRSWTLDQLRVAQAVREARQVLAGHPTPAALAPLLRDPALQGTQEAAEAWLWQAAATAETEPLVRAWVATGDARAQRLLVGALLRDGELAPAVALAQLGAPKQQRARGALAWASDPSPPGWSGRRIETSATHAAPVGRHVVLRGPDWLEVWDPEGPVGRVAFPYNQLGRCNALDEGTALCTARDGEQVQRLVVSFADATWTPLAPTGLMAAPPIQGPDATGPWLWMSGKQVPVLHRSDVLDGRVQDVWSPGVTRSTYPAGVQVHDLDHDGHVEWIVGLRGWGARDLRVLDPVTLEQISRVRVEPSAVHVDGDQVVMVGRPIPEEGLNRSYRGLAKYLFTFEWIDGQLTETSRIPVPEGGYLLQDTDNGWLLVGRHAWTWIQDGQAWRRPLRGQSPVVSGAVMAVDGGFFILGHGDDPLPGGIRPEPTQAPTGRAGRLSYLGAIGLWDHARALYLDQEDEESLHAAIDVTPDLDQRSELLRALVHAGGTPRPEQLHGLLLPQDADLLLRSTDPTHRAHGAVLEVPSASVTFEGPLDARIQVLDAASVRWDPVDSAVVAELQTGRAPLLSIPVHVSSAGWAVEMDVRVQELELGSGLRWTLEVGDQVRTAVLQRRGGSRDHHLAVGVVGAMGASTQLDPGRRTLGWAADPTGRQGSRWDTRGPLAAAEVPVSGTGRLVLRPVDEDYDAHALVRIDAIRLYGLTPLESPESVERDFANGAPGATETLAQGHGVLAALARSRSGAPANLRELELTDAELRLLARRAPETWAQPLLSLLGPEFPRVWVPAWERQWSTDPLGASGVDDRVFRAVPEPPPAMVQQRAHWLVAQGRSLEARRLLQHHLDDTPSDAAVLLIQLLVRAGEREAARAVVQDALAEPAHAPWMEDVLQDDPALRFLLRDPPSVVR